MSPTICAMPAAVRSPMGTDPKGLSSHTLSEEIRAFLYRKSRRNECRVGIGTRNAGGGLPIVDLPPFMEWPVSTRTKSGPGGDRRIERHPARVVRERGQSV